MVNLKSILLILLFFLGTGSIIAEESEEFSEALLLRPLPDRKVLAHFHFESKVPPTPTYGSHHHIFPKSIYQLVHKFRVREMELSFTQGRWNYGRWGGYDPISSRNAKPPGVELWATFDVPQHQVDASWRNLTHALSGLFCASINFLESSTAYSAPQWSFKSSAANVRYGTLPREAVCTENLTPWLKLLPCRDKAGLSALMDRPSIYRGFYHSQRLHLISNEFDLAAASSGMVLEQTLTVVLQPDNLGGGMASSAGSMQQQQPNWSLSSLFGREVSGMCVLSSTSNVYVQLEANLVSKLKSVSGTQQESDVENLSSQAWSEMSFEMSDSPVRVIEEVYGSDKELSVLYEFPLENYSELRSFDLEFRWKLPVTWSSQLAPLQASRFLMGSGNERGAIAISLKSIGRSEDAKSSVHEEGKCLLRVDVFQVVPWYVKVYYHTLKVFLDERLHNLADVIDRINVSPSEDKVSPGLMEIALQLPCDVNSVILTLEFDKGFLHIDEYPPDANQGFDIPSALIRFPEIKTKMHLFEDKSACRSPILSKLQEESPVLWYTEVLLVPLTTPDFSMPYNVITITCTVFALYFGSLLNALRRRAEEEERFLKSRAAKDSGPIGVLLSKLSAKLRGKPLESPKSSSSSSSKVSYKLILRVILVAGVAAAWQYFFG